MLCIQRQDQESHKCKSSILWFFIFFFGCLALWTPISYGIAVNQAAPLWDAIAHWTLISTGCVSIILPFAGKFQADPENPVVGQSLIKDKSYPIVFGLFLIVAGIWLTNYTYCSTTRIAHSGAWTRHLSGVMMCCWCIMAVSTILAHCGLLRHSALDLWKSYPAGAHETKPIVDTVIRQHVGDGGQFEPIDLNEANNHSMSVISQISDDITSFSREYELTCSPLEDERTRRTRQEQHRHEVVRLDIRQTRMHECRNGPQKMGAIFEEPRDERSIHRIDEIPKPEEIPSAYSEWINGPARHAHWGPASRFAQEHGFHDNYDAESEHSDTELMPHDGIQDVDLNSSPDSIGNEI